MLPPPPDNVIVLPSLVRADERRAFVLALHETTTRIAAHVRRARALGMAVNEARLRVELDGWVATVESVEREQR